MERRDSVDVMPVALMAILALLIGFMPLPWDPDLWFHLADGQHILSHGSVPQTDPFSFTKQGELWVPHSWLFDAAAWVVWSGLGARAAEACMAVAFMAAIMISFAVLIGRGVSPVTALGIGLGLAIAAANTRGIRPQVFSLLLCNAVILLMVQHRYRPGWKLLVLLPLVFLVWSQVHGAVVLGLVVAGVWLAGRLMEALAGRSWKAHARELLIGAGALVLSAGAILVTPHRVTLYSYLKLTMNLKALKQTTEWQAPRLWPVEVPDIYLFVLIAAVLVLAARRWRRVGWTEMGLCGALIVLALTGVRHIPLACIGAVPLIAGALAGDGQYVQRHVAGTRRWPAAAGAVALVLLGVLWRYPQGIEARYAGCEPIRGTKALRELQRPMRVFTTHNTGSYVLFAGVDRLKVFIDSRPDVYGDALFQQALQAMSGRGWSVLFERWQIQAAVVQRRDELAEALARQEDWTLLAEDPGAVTFVRSGLVAGR